MTYIVHKTKKSNLMNQLNVPAFHHDHQSRKPPSDVIEQDGDDDDAADEDDNKDDDIYIDDLHGWHMLLLHPLLHILAGKSRVVPDRSEDGVLLSEHLWTKLQSVEENCNEV